MNIVTERPLARLLDPRGGLDSLVRLLVSEGHRVLGPVVREGGIDYAEVSCGDDMPTGLTVEQGPGRWRQHTGDDGSRFGWTPGAASWKQHVFPPVQEVLRVRRTDGSFAVTDPPAQSRPLALIAARDCELRALGILDRVFADATHPDPRYTARREGTFVVAVTCGVPSATCWCTSMGGSPQPQSGYDIRLTELDGGESHWLLAEAGTTRGADVLESLPGLDASEADRSSADRVVEAAVAAMDIRLPGEQLPVLLAGTDTSPHWDRIAERCLSCGNCTMVCPTCFCSTYVDTTSLDTTPVDSAELVREQHWVSCFQLDHSYLTGGAVRATIADRYRQWLLHKLQTWPAQFSTVGCVGCGRCTTWCPAGIDLVAEAVALIDGAAAVDAARGEA